jgi:hypothetical protein
MICDLVCVRDVAFPLPNTVRLVRQGSQRPVWWYGFLASRHSFGLASEARETGRKATSIQVGEIGKNLVAIGLAFHPFLPSHIE